MTRPEGSPQKSHPDLEGSTTGEARAGCIFNILMTAAGIAMAGGSLLMHEPGSTALTGTGVAIGLGSLLIGIATIPATLRIRKASRSYGRKER